MSLMGKVMYFHKVSPQDVIELNRVRISNGLDPFDLSMLPSFRKVNTASETCKTLVSDFMARPIHHENKMTRQEETEMLLLINASTLNLQLQDYQLIFLNILMTLMLKLVLG